VLKQIEKYRMWIEGKALFSHDVATGGTEVVFMNVVCPSGLNTLSLKRTVRASGSKTSCISKVQHVVAPITKSFADDGE
jgi:hypothetical protein